MRSFRFTPLTLNVIRRHAQRRLDAVAIAKLMNCSPGTIENICSKHGIDLVTISDGAPPLSPYQAEDGKRRQRFMVIDVPIGIEAIELITRESARRGVKASMLIARIAEIVAADNLYAAVLDR